VTDLQTSSTVYQLARLATLAYGTARLTYPVRLARLTTQAYGTARLTYPVRLARLTTQAYGTARLTYPVRLGTLISIKPSLQLHQTLFSLFRGGMKWLVWGF